MTETQTAEFDPQAIYDYRPSEEEASGKTPLIPEGNYPNCLIKDLIPFPPSEKYPKPGVIATLKFTFECDTYEGLLEKRITFKKPMKKQSTLWKLLNAVFGKQMDQHTIEDLVGKRVNIYVNHKWTTGADPVEYADFLFIGVPQ